MSRLWLELMTAVLDVALSRPTVPHVNDCPADASDTLSAFEAVSARASGNTGSGKSAYSIILVSVFIGGVP